MLFRSIFEGKDVRVLEPRDQSRFPLERIEHARSHHVIVRHFESHPHSLDGVPSLIHSGETALRDFPIDSILADSALASKDAGKILSNHSKSRNANTRTTLGNRSGALRLSDSRGDLIGILYLVDSLY